MIQLEALFPEVSPVTPDLVEKIKRDKDACLAQLRYEEEADRLLLESTRRLAAALQSAQLDGDPVWESLEQRLNRAYWSLDLQSLKTAISERERFIPGRQGA